MKIRFLKDVTVDIEKPSLNEVWYKQFHRWEEIVIADIFPTGKTATIKTNDGDYILLVPTDAFERIIEKKHIP